MLDAALDVAATGFPGISGSVMPRCLFQVRRLQGTCVPAWLSGRVIGCGTGQGLWDKYPGRL